MGALARLRGWAVILKRDGLTLWFALRHPNVPWYAKAMSIVMVAYAFSPIDLIPDFIPIVGWIDDLIILPLLLWFTLRLIPAKVLAHCRDAAEQWLREKKGKVISFVGGAIILLIWLMIAIAIWRAWIGPWLAA
ncbi:DUF1232 domain-containing protein [uncultured Oxalicibacterium sp.]|uniref:YkvA family protein n=1 Tax=uncultured Oxalicibacterium sp. TaxID=1168540 RepID=UPI0025CE68E4|nr:DUF1232 domain-containing protein [uncultured Oxalicibacterium sp.]